MPQNLLCPAVLLQGVLVGYAMSKSEGTFTLYHSFLMKGWALKRKRKKVRKDGSFQQKVFATPESLPQFLQKSLAASNGHRAQPHRYLRLLLGALLLEILGVFTSSHSLKFRSNTHRKVSLLINNNSLNRLALILSVNSRHYKRIFSI